MPLSDRCRTLLAVVAAAAAESAPTPSTGELTMALQAAGHPIGRNPGLISYELRRLEHAGRITVIGQGRRRVLEITGTGQRTVRRPPGLGPMAVHTMIGASNREAAKRGWPRPTPGSAAAYDAAVRRREFARHEHPEASGPATRISPPLRCSPTGCAAALMAQW
jgi:DNA-binding PadR family transcriptional regulator